MATTVCSTGCGGATSATPGAESGPGTSRTLSGKEQAGRSSSVRRICWGVSVLVRAGGKAIGMLGLAVGEKKKEKKRVKKKRE